MRDLHKIVGFGRMAEEDLQKIDLESKEDFRWALIVVGSIFLSGLIAVAAWVIR